ncbi:MAG: aspartate carbamoyltransferase catalytic subunit [Myxococcota bacterium]
MLSGHLLGIEGLSRATIEHVLDTTDGMREISRRPIKKVPTLRGRTVFNVFYEASTRTRMSFELAAKRLSADASSFSTSGSSVTKGESLLDTLATLQAMQPDAVVIRHSQSGAPHFLARHLRVPIINAGDGMHEHPTQALLDAYTIRQRFGHIEGLEVVVVGDLAHSRVARSNLIALRTLGANVRIAGPRTLVPVELEQAYGCERAVSVAAALEGAHVVMALRLQHERMTGGLVPSLLEYASEYGISAKMLERTRPDAIVMHPGPVNRGVELPPDVIDGPRSVILDQVENGVAVRMAVLFLLLGAGGDA